MQQNISILIVEDEPIWATQLEMHVKNLGYTLAGSFNTPAAALVHLEKTAFDIALLDIRMNGTNAGIALGKIINQLNKKPFIFITSGNDKPTIEEAIAAKPSAFLLKPVSEASLYAAIQTALENFTLNKPGEFNSNGNSITNSLFLKQGTAYKRVEWDDIIALVVDGRYTRVISHDSNEVYLINNSLAKTMTAILPEALKPLFLQINRNEVINLKQIQQLKGTEIVANNQLFTVSENYMQPLKQALQIV